MDIPALHERRSEALSDALKWPGIEGRFLREQYASIELALMKQFEKDLSVSTGSNAIEIYGFASRAGTSLGYYTRPSLAADFGVFCEAIDSRQLPTDFEFGKIRGYRVLRKGSREVEHWKIKECSFEPVAIPVGNLKPEASLSEIEDILWGGYVDPPRQVARSALLAMTSAPAGMGRLGGLTATLLPSDESFQSSQSILLQDLKRAIPSDLTFENTITVRVEKVGKFKIAPFPWTMRGMSPDSRQDRLIDRLGRKKSLEELTIGFSLAPRRLAPSETFG